MSDSDDVGVRGATSLARILRLYAADVRLVTPPKPHKDARAWMNSGAMREDVEEAISAALPLKVSVRLAPKEECHERRRDF
jgi:hypothetical protein